MANPKIEVEIGASVKGLDAGVAKAENTLKGIGVAAQTTAPKVQKLARATSNYNGVGIEFSRIIQDAPFGIIGVGNNITQLASSFQQLRANSTSTGAALKTALSSIISPANLLVLGISAVTTAFTLYSMGAFDSKDATEELTDATEEAKEKLDKYVSSLDSVTKASLTGATATQNELSALKGLQIQAENLNIPIEKRIEAVDELQKQFPDYLGNLSQEQILTGDVGTAYSELTKQLIATGKARASVDSIAKNSIEILQLETRERERLEKIRALETKQAGASTFNPSQSGVVGGNLFSEADIISAKIRDVQKEGIEDRKRINDLAKENLNLESLITSEIEKGGSFTKSKIDGLKEVVSGTEKAKTAFEIFSEAQQLVNDKFFNEGKLAFDTYNSSLSETLRLQSSIESLSQGIVSEKSNINPVSGVQEFENLAGNKPPITEFAETFEEQASGISLIADELVGVFSGLGNQIANSFNISNDALRGFVGTLLSNAPKIIQSIFQQAAARKAAASIETQANLQIATGNAIASASKAANALGPVGLALLPVFVGGAVALISSAFGKGGGGGGGSVGAGVSGQSFTGGGVGGLGGGSRELTGELVVRGNDLVYVLGQSINKITKG